MHLLYLLSADAGNLHAVCCSLAEAMLNLTDSLLRSRIHQQEQQREMPFCAGAPRAALSGCTPL